jgi:hypothetical protein
MQANVLIKGSRGQFGKPKLAETSQIWMIKERVYDSIQDEHLRGGGDQAAALPNAEQVAQKGGR